MMKNMDKELVQVFWKIPGLSNQNKTNLEQTHLEASLTLRDDPIHVREHETTNESLSNLEDDDEIELELVDELELAKSVNDQHAVAENTPAKKIL